MSNQRTCPHCQQILATKDDQASGCTATLVRALVEAADPFVRMTRLQSPLNLSADTPVRAVMPGGWPVMGDAEKLVHAHEALSAALWRELEENELPAPGNDFMREVASALDEYHEALRSHQHGGVAQDELVKKIEHLLGKQFTH